MNPVKLLPPDVIAKIAAGEVVDRPASVVKELFENALDAGATHIDIDLKEAGKELIHIKDNGHGIKKSDLEIMFQRHATSKITSIGDLDSLHSMGFRGEALFSIAAVSDITVRTLSKDETSGWQIHLRGGQKISLEPAASSQSGTDINVAELFFNTPARRGFLKNNASEVTQIINTLLPYGLIYPHLRLNVTHQGKTFLTLKPTPDPLDRIAHALNLRSKDLVRQSKPYQDHGSIQLTLGNINIQRPRRDMQYIFINHRPVESKNIAFNLNDIFKLILPPGVYGLFIAEIHLPSQDVDVNIHPTKREVRIKHESQLISSLRRMAEELLMTSGSIKQIQSLNTSPLFNISSINSSLNSSTDWQRNPTAPQTEMPFLTPHATQIIPSSLMEMDTHLFATDGSFKNRFKDARYIGQWMNKFLLFEQGKSLLFVDQHAAQERIMYETFRDQIQKSQIQTQHLLTPILISLSPTERVALDQIKENLPRLGIDFSLFDEKTLAIQTQPILLKNIEASIRAILAGDDNPHLDHDALSRRACKASIVAGDALSGEQALYQRDQLLSCQDPFICPHGRPTVIEITEEMMNKEFLRT